MLFNETFIKFRNFNIDTTVKIILRRISTEIRNIVVSQDYENFAESTKWKVAPTLACSNYSVGQAKVEQPSIKCF
jgi:hypothetical protein